MPGMGVSLLLCTGNEADLTISDVLPGWRPIA